MTLILGVDPGLQHTGWGIIESHHNALRFIACGIIHTGKGEMPARLKTLHDALAQVVALHQPQEASVEETFVNANGASTLKLGQARGAILLTLSLAHLPVYEYSATSIKKSVVGKGHAEKAQVAMMVNMLLPGCLNAKADAADALAAAICHAHQRSLLKLTGEYA